MDPVLPGFTGCLCTCAWPGPYSWLQGPTEGPQLWKRAQSWASCFPHKSLAYILTPVMNYTCCCCCCCYCCYVAKSRPTLSDPTDGSMPRVHGADDAIQPSHPLLPSVFPSIRVFSNKSAVHIRWQKHWSFSLPHPGLQISSVSPPTLNALFPLPICPVRTAENWLLYLAARCMAVESWR